MQALKTASMDDLLALLGERNPLQAHGMAREVFAGAYGYDFSIEGFDRGTNEEADHITQSADGADLRQMWREFQRSIQLLNRQRQPLLNLLTYDVGAPTERVLLPTQDDFEESSEYGEPKGIRPGTPFVAGYDFKWYDLAIRYTWRFLAEADSDEIRARNSAALEADLRLVWGRVMRTIFNSTNSSATVNDQNVNVYRLYNADGTVPPAYKGTTFSGSHTHYLGSNNATVTPGDLQDMEDHLYHHGYRVTTGYDLVLMVNRQEGNTIRTFKKGTDSALYDFIPSAGYGGGVFLPANSGIVARPTNAVEGFGNQVIGTYGPFMVVEEDFIPAGYMLAYATGGEQNIGNLVGIRQHARESLRGLMLMPTNAAPNQDYPLTDSFYQHGLGTGVRHRGAAVVMQVVASTSYTIPALYA